MISGLVLEPVSALLFLQHLCNTMALELVLQLRLYSS
jgi:hypothetical protein